MNFNGLLSIFLLKHGLSGLIALLMISAIAPVSLAQSRPSSVFSEQAAEAVDSNPTLSQKVLTMRDAIQLVLQNNPELASFEKEVRALHGLTLQAGLLPNPVIQYDAEDISSRRNGPGGHFDSLRISQLFETGGKRSARTQAALRGQEGAEQDYAARRLDIIARAANVFMDVLAGQERLRLTLAGQELAQRVVDAAAQRVQAGKAPPIEETRANVALATADIQVQQAQRNLISLRKQLALLWGSSNPVFEQALGNLESFVEVPDFKTLEALVQKNPLALRSLKNLEQRQALLTLEKARRIPDVTINAGIRRYGYEQPNDTTALVGLSIPLPLFDRNQGNVLAAHQRLHRAVDDMAAIDLQLKTLLTQAYEALIAADTEIRMLRDQVLPGARETFRMASRGYELGRFNFLELLDAQRTLYLNQTLYLTALSNYQRLVNEIERLIAAPIEDDSKQ